MFKAAIKNLLGHKLRMILTGFSIVLGVSFVSGTYIFTDSISSTFNNLFSEVFSGTDLTVRPKQADFGQSAESFPASILSKIQAVDGVSIVSPGVAGSAQLLDKQGKPIGGQGPPTLGFSWGTEPGLNPLMIADTDGRAPTAPGEIIIDKATAEIGKFTIGDKIKVILQGPAEEFTLVGIATFGSSDGLAGATLSAFELSEAQRVFGFEDGSYAEINIKAETNVSPEELKSRVDEILPLELESITGQEQSNEQIGDINEGLGFINTALLAFAGVSIFVGSFIIQNTFRITIAQRSKELALLRAIGATKAQVVRLVIYEAILIAVLASTVGIFLGLIVANGVRALMNSIGFGLPDGPLSIEPRTVMTCLGVGLVVTLLSAIIPAIKASRVSPVEAMSENEASSGTRKSLFKRGIFGFIVSLIGVASLIIGLNTDIDQPIYTVGFGVVLMFIGVSIIAPLLSKPLAQIIGWPLIKLRGGVSAGLARDNAKRTPQRTASTAAALMIGVSLVALLSIIATTFKAEVDLLLEDSFPADLTVQSTNIGEFGPGSSGFSVNALNALKATPELVQVTALRYQFEGAKVEDEVMFIVGVDTENFNNVVKIGPSENAFENLNGGGILVFKAVADENGWSIGQDINIEFALTGKKLIKIVGTFSEQFDSDYIISSQTYLANFGIDDVTLVAANVREGIIVSDGKLAAQKALSGYSQVLVQDQEDLRESISAQIDQILALFWGLLGFAIIIAVLGITNTLMLSISERTKEIGMLRAIGMTRKQVRQMIRYESVIIALFGAIMGVVMGTFFAWAVLRALASEGITGFVVPYGQIALYFVIAVIAGILAAAWPARKASRMDILKAIYHD